MNNKTKEYLQQIYRAQCEVIRLQDAIDNLHEQMYSLSSPSGNMSPDRVQSSTTGDKIEKLVAQADEVERDLVARRERWLDLYRKITKQIERMPTEKYREILWKRYVICQKWPRIIRDLNKDPRWVYRMHGEALLEFSEINSI